MNPNNNAAPVQTYWDRHDFPRVPLSEGIYYLEQSIRHKRKRGVILMVGEAGVGKSQAVRALARKYDYKVADIRMAQFGQLSAGVPQRAEGDHFKIAVPDNMPKPGEKTILLFEEPNQGPNAAIAMFFQLLEDRELYNYKLPEDTVIVALMNPATADYAVTRIENNAALNRRLKKFFVYSTFSDWLAHAKTNEFHHSDGLSKPCHPVIQRFLTATPSALYDEKARTLGKQYPAPATWQTASLDLYMLELDEVPLISDRAKHLLASTIGNTMADTLVSYIAKNETLLSAVEILTNYSPRSKIRSVVLEELKNGGGEMARLQEEVPTYLIAEKPPVHEIADNFARFVADLAKSAPARAEALYTHLRVVALEEAGGMVDQNREYMKELNVHLRNNQDYRSTHELFSQLHAEMLDPEGTDPMAD